MVDTLSKFLLLKRVLELELLQRMHATVEVNSAALYYTGRLLFLLHCGVHTYSTYCITMNIHPALRCGVLLLCSRRAIARQHCNRNTTRYISGECHGPSLSSDERRYGRMLIIKRTLVGFDTASYSIPGGTNLVMTEPNAVQYATGQHSEVQQTVQ